MRPNAVFGLHTIRISSCWQALPRSSAIMCSSYPGFEWVNDLSIKFRVPGKKIVYKIIQDSEDRSLRKRSAGQALSGRLRKIAGLLSRHRICIESISAHELEIVLFLPPPPCPPPKMFTKFTSRLGSLLRRRDDTPLEKNTEWVTLYDYIPGYKHDRYASLGNVSH